MKTRLVDHPVTSTVSPSADGAQNQAQINEIRDVFASTRGLFPFCKDFMSFGLKLEDLNHTIGCISFFLQHDTVSFHVNGNCLIYCCRLNVDKDGKRTALKEEGCPFRLCFVKRGGFWFFNNTKANTVRRNCSFVSFPDLCTSHSCLALIISEMTNGFGKKIMHLKAGEVFAFLTSKGLSPGHYRTVRRVVCQLKNKTADKILESEQKIEDYIRHLNKNLQYGVLLYNTGELIIPGAEESGKYVKKCMLGSRPVFRSSVPLDEMFWDRLPDVEAISESKSVLFTFEAVKPAVEAFWYSIPVVCLDASFVKCPGSASVLMTASFMTTERNLLPMCYGTAPGETNDSWSFFLVNLRQVLRDYCKGTLDWRRVVFMSDRHMGILEGVELHFPESHHLYCAVHLLRNVNTRGMNCYHFWRAVEATCKEEFQEACRQAAAPKLIRLMACASHWSRFGIRESECRRYGVRTNNWAESLNNALRNERSGPLLQVVMNAFRYSCKKIAEYHKTDNGERFTSYAMDIYKSNALISRNCTVAAQSAGEWQVREAKMDFFVRIPDFGEMSCSCHRYYDEGIPCQHILKVLDHTRKIVFMEEVISPIYLKERYYQAFPGEFIFIPKDEAFYAINPLVVPCNRERRIGAPRTRRYASVGEFRAGRSLPHSVSRPPVNPLEAGTRQCPFIIDDDDDDAVASQDAINAAKKSDEDTRNALDRALATLDLNHICFSSVIEFSRSQTVDELEGDNEEGIGENYDEDEDAIERDHAGVDHDEGIDEDHALTNGTHGDNGTDNEDNGDDNGSEDKGYADANGTHEDNRINDDNGRGNGNRTDDNSDIVLVEHSWPDDDDKKVKKEPLDIRKVEQIPKSRFVARGPTFFMYRNIAAEPCKKRGRTYGLETPSHMLNTVMSDTKRVPQRKHNDAAKKLRHLGQMLPERSVRQMQELYLHDDDVYSRWEKLYMILPSIPVGYVWDAPVQKPTEDRPVILPFVPNYLPASLRIEELEKLSDENEWDATKAKPIISIDLVKKFLARVHAFTTVGLEAQATAYSCTENGVIKYLAFYPQKNGTSKVETDSDLSHSDAYNEFKAIDPATKDMKYHPCCWIHTHPRWPAYMSCTDIFQIDICERMEDYSFSIVISPRHTGLKILCVSLTHEGSTELKRFREMAKGAKDSQKEIMSLIRSSKKKFYYQVPFELSNDPCVVVDFREKDQVCDRIRNYIAEGDADYEWM